MKKIARSLRQHESSDFQRCAAGLNNKAKVTMRKSYGFRTYRILKLALDHSLGMLPEPGSNHDFF
jgi:transposase